MAGAPAATVRTLASLPAEPWKNGGGLTRTLAQSGQAWRVSLAEITRNGAYSSFPGMCRHSVILSGDGVDLQSGERQMALRPHRPTHYDGAPAWQASLLQGPCTALNVMAAESQWHAAVHALPTTPQGTLLPPARVVLVLCGGQALSLAALNETTAAKGQSEPFMLQPGQYVMLEATGAEALCMSVCSSSPSPESDTSDPAYAILLNPT